MAVCVRWASEAEEWSIHDDEDANEADDRLLLQRAELLWKGMLETGWQ